MPTIQEEKPAKARSRSRKGDQRSSKSGQPKVEQTQVEQAPIEMKAEPEAVSAMVAETEAAAVDSAVAVSMEQAFEPALSGEVLPPDVIEAKSELKSESMSESRSHVDGLQAVAQAYGDYARKSWLNSRFLVERLMTVRSFDEAIEIQGEFAKQAYTNFLVQSEKICVLYGEWAQQFFRPLVWRH